MEINKFWEKTSTAGREAMVCVGAGFGAWFFALLFGADQSIAMFFGLIVFGGFGAVGLWAWAQANKRNGRAIGVDIGTCIMLGCGVAAMFGVLFFSEWLAIRGFWGILAGLAIAVVSAMSRHPEK